MRKLCAAFSTGGGVEINIVYLGVGGGIFQSQFDKIILVNHNHRSRNGAVESECPHRIARGHFYFFFLDGKSYLHYFWAIFIYLVKFGKIRRSYHLLGYLI